MHTKMSHRCSYFFFVVAFSLSGCGFSFIFFNIISNEVWSCYLHYKSTENKRILFIFSWFPILFGRKSEKKYIETKWNGVPWTVGRNMYSVVDGGTGQMQSTQLTRKKTNRITFDHRLSCDPFSWFVRFISLRFVSFLCLKNLMQNAKIILPWTRNSLDFAFRYKTISMAEQIDAHTSKITSLHLPNVFLLFIYERIIKC